MKTLILLCCFVAMSLGVAAADNQTAIVIKSEGEPALITFSLNGEFVGSLKIKNGRIIFQGNADESARMFLQYLNEHVKNLCETQNNPSR